MKSRDMQLYELRLLLIGYMQNEDIAKAQEVFKSWCKAVKVGGV